MNPDLEYKLALYQNTPDVFSDDELDLFKSQLTEAGVDKNIIDGIHHAGPNRSGEFSLARTIGNFLEGTIEGATTLSAGVTEPTNVVEDISRSLGSLAGFVGALPVGGGVLPKALGASAKALRGAQILQKSQNSKKAADILDSAGEAYKKFTGGRNAIPIPSVPKMTSEYLMGHLGRSAKYKELAKSYEWLRKGTVPEGIMHEAISLGLMSSMSTLTVNPANWKETFDDAIGAFFSGGAMGAAFGGIGNFVKLKKAFASSDPSIQKAAETTLKGIVGAITQGMFMHASTPDDVEIPIAKQMYEYALGAYFGSKAQPALQRGIGQVQKEAMEKKVPLSEIAKDVPMTKEMSKEIDKMEKKGNLASQMLQKEIQDITGQKEYSPNDYLDVNITAGINKGLSGKIVTFNENTGVARVDIGKTNAAGDPIISSVKFKNMEFKDPAETEYKPGETFLNDNVNEGGSLLDSIEYKRASNTYINKNLENASYEISRMLMEQGAPQLRAEIVEKIQKAVNKKSDFNFNSIIESIQKQFPELPIGSETAGNKLNNLGMYLRRYAKGEQNKQTVNMMHVNFNEDGPVLEPYGHLNVKGQVVQEKRRHVAKWVGKKRSNNPFTYNEIAGKEGFIEGREGKVFGVKSKVFREQDLVNPEWNKTKASIETQRARYTHFKKTQDLYANDKFVLGGNGEKDNIIITDLQFPKTPTAGNQQSPLNYILQATRGYIPLQKQIRANRDNFVNMNETTRKQRYGNLGRYSNAKYVYENMVASKIIWLENLNNKPFKQMLDANAQAVKEGRRKPFIDNMIDLNKRFPVLHASEPALDKGVFLAMKDVNPDGTFNIPLVRSINKDGTRNKYQKIISKTLNNRELDAHRDGIYVLRQDIFDALIADGGLPRNVGSAKGTLLTTMGDNGLMLGKYAYHRASGELNKSYERDGIHGELYDTGIKQLGNRTLYDVVVKKGKSLYVDPNAKKREELAASVVAEKIPITDHRINLGVYENPKKNLENVVSALQRWEWSYSPYLKKAKVTQKEVKDFFRELTNENFEGKPEINEILKKGKRVTEEDLLKLQEVNIDDMSVNEVMKIASSSKDSPLYRTIWDKLHRRFNETLDVATGNDFIDTEAMDQVMDYYNVRSMSDLIIKMAKDPTPMIINHKWVKQYSDMVLKNYLLKRVNQPKEQYSSKHIFMPYDRYMQINKDTKGMKSGQVFLYKDAAQAKMMHNGKEKTIEQAFKEDPNVELVLLRIPADNISGQRVVTIKGILKEKGTGIIVHPEDMHFMGGADLDIDSGFMYRATPKKYRDAIKNSKNVMKDVEPTGDAAQKKFAGETGVGGVKNELIKQNEAFMLDPMYSEQVGNNSHVNNSNLGIAVSTGQFYGRTLDFVKNNPGKEYKFNVDGDKTKLITGLLGKEKAKGIKIEDPTFIITGGKEASIQKYMETVQEAINMYADAGKFGALINSKALKTKLFEETGLNVSVKFKSGLQIPLSKAQSARVIDDLSVFASGRQWKTALNGSKYVDGTKTPMSINEIKQAADRYLKELEYNGIDPNDMPGVLTVKAEKFSEFQDNYNYIGSINTTELKNMVKASETLAKKYPLLDSFNPIRDIRAKKGQPGDREFYRDLVSNQMDFATTVVKLKNTYLKAEKEMTVKEWKEMQEEVTDAASELRVSWQLEKYWNKTRKEMAGQGQVRLADIVNKAIKRTAEEYRKENPIKEQLFYDILTSNVITLNNQKAQVIKNNMLQKLSASSSKGVQQEQLANVFEQFKKDKYNALTQSPYNEVTKEVNLDLMYSSNTIPAKYLKNHFRIRQTLEEKLQGFTPAQEAQIKEIKTTVRDKIRGYQEGKARQELIDKVEKQVDDSAELRQMQSDVRAILDRNPNLVNVIDRVFPTIALRPYKTALIDDVYGVSIKDATAADVQNFINYFKSNMTAKEWKDYKAGSKMDKDFKKRAFLEFPETVANRVGPFDMDFVPVDAQRKIIKGGKLVPKKDLLVPMSSFERLYIDNKNASEIVTGLTDQMNNTFMKGKFDWLQSINDQNIQRIAVEAAIGLHEAPLAKTHKTYKDGLNRSIKILEDIGKEKYNVSIGKETREVTGEFIVKKLQKDIKDTVDFIKKRILKTDVPFRDFVDPDNTGDIRIRKTIEERISKRLRDPNFQETFLKKDGIADDISSDNVFKFIELWKRSEQLIDHKGNKILARDLREVDPKEWTAWLKRNVAAVDKYHGVGTLPVGYFPHRNIPKAIINEYIDGKTGEKGGANAALKEYINQELRIDGLDRADGGAMRDYNSIILNQGDRSPERFNIKDKSAQTLAPNLRRRSANLPEYEKSVNVLSQYMGQVLKARYNAMMALSNANTIREFMEKTYKDGTPVMGSEKNREHWSRFMKIMSLKDVGGQHILPEQWLNDKSFPMSKIYTAFTEGQLFKRLKGMGKFFGNEEMFLPKDRNGKISPEALSDRINWMSNVEARVSTSTLLFNTRGWVYNMFGGNTNTVISAGLRPFRKSFDYKYLRSIIPDPEAKPGAVDNRGKEWFLNWAKEKGVLETFWTSELAANTSFRAIKNMKGYTNFWEELRQAARLQKDTRTDKRDVMEVLQKYKIDQKATDLGGFFMKHAEQELRLRAFLAHYIKARDVFAARGQTFGANDPALIKIALEGTTGSQYLYNNVARPVATASPAGRVMSRFQLWAGNSLRKRKDITRMARDAGFEGEAAKKFERMMLADMFMFGMASMLPYSMFDATLPPPYSYYTEMSQMLYGSPQEKERAFFGTLPYPLNITGLITPPSARFVMQPLGNMLTGDWERFWDYQIYTWFPYGMVLKTGNDIAKSPIKAVDKLTGFPLYRLNYMSKDEEE